MWLQFSCHVCVIQVFNAALYGVIGVLIYSDPLVVNEGLMSDINETYPHSWYMPPSGVERGSFHEQYGDELTPYLAAKGDQWLVYNMVHNIMETYSSALFF